MNWIKLAELFGLLNKARNWVRGKKELTANLAQLPASTPVPPAVVAPAFMPAPEVKP